MLFTEIEKEYMKQNGYEMIAEKDKSKRGYICPACGSGTGEHGTGLSTYDNGIHYKCFACGFKGDIFDYVKVKYGLEKSFIKTYELMHMDNKQPIKENILSLKAIDNKPKLTKEEIKDKQEKAVKFYAKCCKNLLVNNTIGLKYMLDRGFSKSTLLDYSIGFVRTKAYSKNGYTGNYIIIPISESFYIMRGCGFNFKRNNLLTGFSVDIWIPLKVDRLIEIDRDANKKYKNVIVCEGCMDALSCLELGYNAISLNSTSNKNKFIDYAKKHPQYNYIIEMDNDRAGSEANTYIINALKDTGVNYKVLNIVKTYKNGVFKDLNACLMDNKTVLKKHIDILLGGKHENKEEIA